MIKLSCLGSSIIAVAVSWAGAVFAQAPATKPDKPAPPSPAALRTPPPELDLFAKPYEGDWKCDTSYPAGAWGSGKSPTTAKVTMKIKKEMGGLWYRGEYEVEKNPFVPPLRAVFVVGYDSATKSPIVMKYDNSGTMVLETAAGATPEKQVYVGEASVGAKKVKFRDTMARKGANQFEHTFEMDTGRGFQLMGTEVCAK